MPPEPPQDSERQASDPNQAFFRTDHLTEELRTRTVRSSAVTISAQGLKFVITMGSTVILARLLSPDDYGLIGMVTVVTGFVQLFKDLGLAEATIQQEEITHRQVSTLFWINVGFSLGIALVVALLAPVVAWFYREPRLISITLVLATTFIFSGLAVQHQALLRRQMAFAVLAKIEIAALLVGVLIAQGTAFYGAGYWALVYMQLASALVYVLGAWLACRWKPGVPRWTPDLWPMLSFGGNLTGFRGLNYFSRNFDNVLIGRVWGAGELGLYSKAYQLLLLPINQINGPVYSVVLSTLSRLQQDPERYRRVYFKAVLGITTLGMPLVAFLFATAEQVIELLLGQTWMGVVPIFQFLMPAAFVATFTISMGWVYQSLGRVDRQFRWGIFSSGINVITFLVSVRWGAVGVAAAYGVLQPILLAIEVVYCYRGTHLSPVELLQTLAKPGFAALGAAALLVGFNRSVALPLPPWLNLGLEALLYGGLYLALWLTIPGGRKTLVELLQVTQDLKRKP
ncbi:lipopolysaccharide biosynthesis protein [Leptolyngbya sp. BL0902]|uniref:lipopolysaccharide biosynthesis protein n=1 Tax=Leptolyngbya sp. BL0902 TaxID=1115757 RepID=UPI0018E8A1A5|nr:lipopolysaccharide biosynthesis protein [Leptolyngbya sp. BL0902]QQE66398.1 lipopolysaccharide biosynthesis protein [Leptolyngbya sp. BL0902]